MNFPALTYALWAAELFGNAALFAILIFRQRWRDFPVFTVFQSLTVVEGVLLYAVNLHGSLIWYERVYYAADCLNAVFEAGMVWEIARVVLRPTGTWVRDAKRQFILWGLTGILLAATLPLLSVRPDPNLLRVWDTRIGLFTDIVIIELIIVLLLTSSRLGLAWRNHVMALATGLGVTAAVGSVINGLHGLLGVHRAYIVLEQIGQFAFPLIFLYWIVQFWREEPARRPLSPELSAYILALHESVKNNLDTVNAQR